MKVLLSIKPQYADAIFSGKKKYEFRKQIFKKEIRTVIVYSSSPVKKIIGEFEIETIEHDQIDALWKKTRTFAGINFDYFQDYFSNKNYGYAIKVKNTKLYDKPLDLQITFGILPPQSFAYIS